ncbi:LLM class flavin-dependent oxidoreductase [Micromonospora globispora]|uniref:LLM class flavin-dependent oxidoreductase n=1 Tax=Micromonospora globispora TaxID=1450148 RepID=A0A317K225_9ACTN|nr:LLM class flavin-dependent oxidoreductase [Micromonospora globispora]PWU47139.1 LLM class flavin-dependent oxidoreductase [Micromonospora globispora]RQW96691.1 LLM class flavin-dependent oxidoreductase [Micromonospora globispora]
MSRTLHLNAFLMGVGHHEAAWRHPRTDPRRVGDVRHFQELARIAERGTLDSVFLADGLAVGPAVRHNIQAVFEPLTLLASLAAVTEHIGLIATVSTTYNEPFNVARKFASLDHLSGGRAGWNIVTSAQSREAWNFNLDDHPAHADRYRRAAEFVDVAIKLWDSWEDDALVLDTAAGVFADTDRVHEVGHTGEHFTVRGPLNTPRPPQGRPLLVQAGSSADGIAFAARYAEAVFTAQQTLADGQAFYAELKRQTIAAGRDPDLVKVLPGIAPVIGGTEVEARALADELEALIVPEHALSQLSGMTGVDLTGLPLDGPVPELPDLSSVQSHQSRYQLVVELARREKLTIRQLIGRLGGGRGHRVVAGTPEQIADQIELWFSQGAADGFNVMPPLLPYGLEAFVDHVVPLLRERGLFRHEYTGRTLREHYGLPRPASAYAARELVTA